MYIRKYICFLILGGKRKFECVVSWDISNKKIDFQKRLSQMLRIFLWGKSYASGLAMCGYHASLRFFGSSHSASALRRP